MNVTSSFTLVCESKRKEKVMVSAATRFFKLKNDKYFLLPSYHYDKETNKRINHYLAKMWTNYLRQDINKS